ncbi:MAG: diacylglycerol kinase family protein [Acidimicrobiia bacterium]|nr:diacylglycerol kinase family protein [Acidimicrobiia bacterium]
MTSTVDGPDALTSVVSNEPLIASVVGIDGCGKSSAFWGSTVRLGESVRVTGVGDEIIAGEPGVPVTVQHDAPLSRSARAVGAIAKGMRRPGLYKQLKFVEFIERARIRQHLAAHDPAAVVVSDGDPLVNSAAWAVARYYRRYLASDDDRLTDVLHFLAGDRQIPWGEMSYYLRHAWHLVLLNRLHVARFGFPDVVFLLEIDPDEAMERIRQRGRPLQAHETVPFLTELAAAYQRVCALLEKHCGVQTIVIAGATHDADQTAAHIADHLADLLTTRAHHEPAALEIIATTMSGSLQDQRKVGQIGPVFESLTSRSCHVHTADSHAEARRLANALVAEGARTLVSAGGAGTFNAVLEGSHVDGNLPPELRVAFLRKGSADLIGKALHISDDLEAGARAIVEGVEHDRVQTADVLAVSTIEPDGTAQQRHLVGFGGFGIFGDVPRFTESRFIKAYKGVLGTLFGDLGPFYVGLLLATLTWWVRRLLGCVTPMTLTIDGSTELGPETWGAVLVLNGDLGKDFPLGRDLPLSSGNFRVVALPYRGLRTALGQINACRTGDVLDRPDAFGAVVGDAVSLVVTPRGRRHRYMVNVDGLQLPTKGTTRIGLSGRITLVAGPDPANR